MTIFLNSHSSYFFSLENVFYLMDFFDWKDNVVLCTDLPYEGATFGVNIHRIVYNKESPFNKQVADSLLDVASDYIVWWNDDYYPCASYDENEVSEIMDWATLHDADQIRLVRGPNFCAQYDSRYYKMSRWKRHLFSQTPTIWSRKKLLQIYSSIPKSGIARKGTELQAEVLSDYYMRIFVGASRSFTYFRGDEVMVGANHFSCGVMPNLTSVVVDGEWNLREYGDALDSLQNLTGRRLGHREAC